MDSEIRGRKYVQVIFEGLVDKGSEIRRLGWSIRVLSVLL